jgi:DnaJ-related protein SCJ1
VHLDGSKVPLKRSGITQPGFIQVIEDQGMPIQGNPDSTGKLFVEYEVIFPSSLSAEEKQGKFEGFIL